VPDVHVLPHFDRYSGWIPNFAAHLLVGEGYHVVGIDEDTALVADPQPSPEWRFRVVGRQQAWILSPQGPQPISELSLRVVST
jgi:hypothetical protein